MQLNFVYFKSVLAALKIISIVLLIISCLLGLHSFLSSEYNKNCMDGVTPQPTAPPTTVWSTTTSTVSPISSTNGSTTTTRRSSTITTTTTTPRTTTGAIVSGDPLPSSSTEFPEEEKNVDKAPILWMERFLIIVTGTCAMFAVVLLILHLVKADLLEQPKFRGFDFGFHFFSAILLLVSAVFMTFSAVKIDKLAAELCSNAESCQLMGEKLSASAFAFFSGFMFFAICVKTYGKKFYQTV